MIELSVNDMTCGHCVSAVTKAVKQLDRDAEVKVDLGTKRVSVNGQIPRDAVIRALGEAGYEAVPAEGAPKAAKRGGCCGSCG